MSLTCRLIAPTVATAISLLAATSPASANHIGTPAKDAPGTRTRMGKAEGYLQFSRIKPPNSDTTLPNGVNGEERTGWTDIRHPALSGPLAPTSGYDRSDHFVTVDTKIVTDGTPNAPQKATPDIRRDFFFASQVWVQSGLSVIGIAESAVTQGNVTFPLSVPEQDLVAGSNRAGPPAIDHYYVASMDAPPGKVLNGVTIKTTKVDKSIEYSVLIADSAHPTTFAHELGHVFTDRQAIVPSKPAEPEHALNGLNILASGDDRIKAESPDLIGPSMSKNANGTPKVGGLEQVDVRQTTHVFNPVSNPDPSVFLNITDRHEFAGDRADFDWVEDNRTLELAGCQFEAERCTLPAAQARADNHPGLGDQLLWRIGDIAPSSHPAQTPANGGHAHGSWGELPLPAFNGESFRFVDVVSQIARFADLDLDGPGGAKSDREAALDYLPPQFSPDGSDGSWIDGELVKVFKEGWKAGVDADNYLARWMGPKDSKFVRIQSQELGPLTPVHDGNSQIDALIAAQGPLPNGRKGASLGSGNSPVLDFDGKTGTLSFSDGIVDTLGLNGESFGIDPLFSLDPLVGATISISDFQLVGPMDLGFLFEGGSIQVVKDGNIFLSAEIPLLLIDDTMKGIFGNNMVGELTEIFLNHSLQSQFLEAFEAWVLSPTTLATEFFGLTGPDLVPLIESGSDFQTSVKTYVGHSAVPEPGSLILILIGLSGMWLVTNVTKSRDHWLSGFDIQRDKPMVARRGGAAAKSGSILRAMPAAM